ncbi:MAG: DoxX family protein [Paracoccaceae bacterium]
MSRYETVAVPLGRVLLAAIFIISGLVTLADLSGTAAHIESGGLPGFLVYPTVLLELAGGAMILVGYRTRWAALLLAAFSVVAGVLYHLIPAFSLAGVEQQLQMIMFLKNLGLAGGFLVLFAHGPGHWSLDEHYGISATHA